jgi:flagellin-like hook-associated protein FlgL
MSGIVLSASVRQNLLSLQSTADLLSTTQNRLSTGNKVNSALDNPTNYFTAQSLNNRASDINNLLDGIGNGVQVLQAANTGITSLQKLVDSAKSVANQALQTQVGYTKSSLTSAAITGATGANLLGTAGSATSGTLTAGAFSTINVSGTGSAATAATTVDGSGFANIDVSSGSVGFTLSVDGTSHAININAAAVTAFTGAGGTIAGTASALTAADVAKIADYQFNGSTTGTGPVTASGGQLHVASATTGASSNVTLSGFNGTPNGGSLGLAPANNSGSAIVPPASDAFTVTVDGAAHNVTLSAASVAAYNTNGPGAASPINAASLSASDVANLINYQVGSSVATVVGGALTFTSGTTGTSSSVATSAVTSAGTASGSTGITATSNTGAAGVNALSGKTLTIGATGGGTATTITFGTGNGQVSTLDQLNAALAANNLQATIDTTGVLTLTTTNDAASANIGAIGGTAVSTGGAPFASSSVVNAVADPTSQAARASLVSQYNNIIQQITTTSQDSSYNGVNLLNGDQLKLTFNETGKSTLNITGVNFNPAGLGLSALTSGTDFVDNLSTNKVLTALNNASSSLRSEASALGSNLSIVQIRQDFSKNLINVLQTGSSNLTLADTNEEAANSQALSTRQSIAVSALALANQSQQSVLKLLQ